MSQFFIPPADKILPYASVRHWADNIHGQGSTIVVTNGCFDILHAGHLSSLLAAAKLGDYLIVGINSDESVKHLKGPSRPIINESDRALMLASLTFVDAVTIFQEDRPVFFFEALQPDYYVKGGDYTFDTLDPGERAVLEKTVREFKFVPTVPEHSTTDIVKRIKES